MHFATSIHFLETTASSTLVKDICTHHFAMPHTADILSTNCRLPARIGSLQQFFSQLALPSDKKSWKLFAKKQRWSDRHGGMRVKLTISHLKNYE